jgi:uncharacterized protein (DUF433 family)
MIKREELTNPASCLNRAHEDEMTFVLLGRDKAAPVAIHAWVTERLRLGKNTQQDAQITEARLCAEIMEGNLPKADERAAEPALALPDDHLKHVQAFLQEMYAIMIDPVEDATGNIADTCRLLINAARRDRDTINHLMQGKPDPAPACPHCHHSAHSGKCLQALRVGKPGEDQFCLCDPAPTEGAPQGIWIDPQRQGGFPCIKGTRIQVHLVLRALALHADLSGVTTAYPDLTADNAKDALWFACEQLAPGAAPAPAPVTPQELLVHAEYLVVHCDHKGSTAGTCCLRCRQISDGLRTLANRMEKR